MRSRALEAFWEKLATAEGLSGSSEIDFHIHFKGGERGLKLVGNVRDHFP